MKAEQNGNINYYPAIKETRTITISNSTGICEILANRNALDNYYNIQGFKIGRVKSKGIYIKNGKKFIIN